VLQRVAMQRAPRANRRRECARPNGEKRVREQRGQSSLLTQSEAFIGEEDWRSPFMTPISKRRAIDFKLIAAKLNIENGAEATPAAETVATRTTCFRKHLQAATLGQDEYNQWPANGQRRSHARKLQQWLTDTWLRRIRHEFHEFTQIHGRFSQRRWLADHMRIWQSPPLRVCESEGFLG